MNGSGAPPSLSFSVYDGEEESLLVLLLVDFDELLNRDCGGGSCGCVIVDTFAIFRFEVFNDCTLCVCVLDDDVVFSRNGMVLVPSPVG